MGKCLVTQLLGVADNSSLPKLGGLKLALKAYDGGIIQANQNIQPTSDNTILITILDDGVTITGASNGATMVDSKHGYISSAWNSTLQLSGASAGDIVHVDIEPKYDIKLLYPSNYSEIDLSELKYCTGMTQFKAQLVPGVTGSIGGDIAALGNLTEIEGLQLMWNPDLYGDIASLGKLTSLTTFSFASNRNIPSAKNEVTGNLASFVAAQRANGRTSCTGITVLAADWMNFGLGNETDVRFYDPSATLNAKLKWDATHIDYYCEAKSRAYVMGYTQQEIDAMKGSGGVYEGYVVLKCD